MAKLIIFVKRIAFRIEFYFRWKLGYPFNYSKDLVPLILLLQFRNEAGNLPGFFDNVCKKVNRIIALDDASSDQSASIAAAIPGLRLLAKTPIDPHYWDEPGNKRMLINEALSAAPCWVMVLDADERLEASFRERANLAIHLATRYNYYSLALKLGELWDSPTKVRVDGIWGKKRRLRLFLLEKDYQLQPDSFHAGWNSASRNTRKDTVPVDIRFYHLGTLTASQRQSRMQKYKQLDPDNRFQTIGYDYLTDTRHLKVKEIPTNRGYM